MTERHAPCGAIDVDGLVMSYADVRAVDDISFSVSAGEFVALLGPNGAGKTTTVEVLEGHRRPTSGRVRVLGMDPWRGGRRFRERIGIVLQEAGLDGDLTVRETLRQFADFYPYSLAPDTVVEMVRLDAKRTARVRTLSGGQRRRLDLALGLVGNPEILFLDEPTTGFDPQARREAWHMLQDLHSLGTTTLLTSHYMDEVEHLADRVIVLRAGSIVADGPPRDLQGEAGRFTDIRFRAPSWIEAIRLIASADDVVERAGSDIVLRTVRPTEVLRALTAQALSRGEELSCLTVRPPTLEDAYLDLVK